MLLTFVGALAVAVFAACVAFILRRTFGIRARWLVPASAGAAMLGFTIWNDYTWFSRNAAGLPGSVAVAETFATSWAVQPWTLLAPAVTRYQAIDLGTVRRREGAPHLVRARVFLVARHQPAFETWQIFDCAETRRADAPPEGLPQPDDWRPLDADDPLLRLACGAGRDTAAAGA